MNFLKLLTLVSIITATPAFSMERPPQPYVSPLTKAILADNAQEVAQCICENQTIPLNEIPLWFDHTFNFGKAIKSTRYRIALLLLAHCPLDFTRDASNSVPSLRSLVIDSIACNNSCFSLVNAHTMRFKQKESFIVGGNSPFCIYRENSKDVSVPKDLMERITESHIEFAKQLYALLVREPKNVEEYKREKELIDLIAHSKSHNLQLFFEQGFPIDKPSLKEKYLRNITTFMRTIITHLGDEYKKSYVADVNHTYDLTDDMGYQLFKNRLPAYAAFYGLFSQKETVEECATMILPNIIELTGTQQEQPELHHIIQHRLNNQKSCTLL